MMDHYPREEGNSFSGTIQTPSSSGFILTQIQETSGVFFQKHTLGKRQVQCTVFCDHTEKAKHVDKKLVLSILLSPYQKFCIITTTLIKSMLKSPTVKTLLNKWIMNRLRILATHWNNKGFNLLLVVAQTTQDWCWVLPAREGRRNTHMKYKYTYIYIVLKSDCDFQQQE